MPTYLDKIIESSGNGLKSIFGVGAPSNNRSSNIYEITRTVMEKHDKDAFELITKEKEQRAKTIPLIASENYMSDAVAMAAGSPDLGCRNMESNIPGTPFYQGEAFAQAAQELAISRATQLFGCNFANVQPLSGSTANLAIGKALAKKLGRRPKVMSLSMADGGHFTHGSDGNALREICDVVEYSVQDEAAATAAIHREYPLMASIPPDGLLQMNAEHLHTLNYTDIEKKARQEKPDVIIVGGSAYPRAIDFKVMKEIAHKNGALLWADVSHYSGLIVAGEYPNPFAQKADGSPDPEHSADIVMTTTHKSLRGPRGGLIMWNDSELSKPINEAVFPGIQGEPHPGIMLAKAVAFGEAGTEAYRDYAKQVKRNAKMLEKILLENGFTLITGGTDSHMVNIDLRPLGINGTQAAKALERAGIITNKMPIPGDTNPDYSGLRIGTPAATTMGLTEEDFEQRVAKWIVKVLQGLAKNPGQPENNEEVEKDVKKEVEFLCNISGFENQVGLSSSGSHRKNPFQVKATTFRDDAFSKSK